MNLIAALFLRDLAGLYLPRGSACVGVSVAEIVAQPTDAGRQHRRLRRGSLLKISLLNAVGKTNTREDAHNGDKQQPACSSHVSTTIAITIATANVAQAFLRCPSCLR